MKEYVLGFLFSDDFRDVVLIHKNKPSWQAGKLNGLGGLIEPADPSPEFAMVRKFHEECGVTIDNWVRFATMEGTDWRVYCFSAKRPWLWLYDQVASRTDEKVEIFDRGSFIDEYNVMIDKGDLLPNVFWLMDMAHEFLRGTQPKLTIKYHEH